MNWEFIGLPECPYMKRIVILFRYFAIRLHIWQSSDDHRFWHDHAWWFITIVLWGGYTDISDKGLDILRFGSIRLRPANHKHTVHIDYPGTITLVISGRPLRRWGFWVKGKLIKRDKYFAVYGHHPCMDGETPVRLKPDKSKIES